MTIHEYGTENQDVIVLVHPSLVLWDYFEYVIPYLEKKYHLVIPALPGYDPEVKDDFTSVEKIAGDLAHWLQGQGISRIACIYGCSMGGSIVLRFLADHIVQTDVAVIDGGITPYQLPRMITRVIALRDYLMILMGKIGGIRLLEKAFATDDYSDEDLQYVADVLQMISRKTIWRTFDSCNNYRMPEPVNISCQNVHYWYTDAEAKARKWDIDYVRKHVPHTVFRCFRDVGHGGLAVLHPQTLAEELESVIGGSQV